MSDVLIVKTEMSLSQGCVASFISSFDEETIGVGIRYNGKVVKGEKQKYQVYSCTAYLGDFDLDNPAEYDFAVKAVEVAYYG